MAKKREDETLGLRPWTRRKGESPEAHQAYLRYQHAGVGRTQAKLCAEHGYCRQLIERWASRWQWQERIRGYDSHVAEVEQRGHDEVIRERAAEWQRRKDASHEETYMLAQALRARVEEMLAHPITKRKTREDGTVVIQPVRWNHGNMATLANLISVLEKIALDGALPEKDGEDEPTVSLDIEAALLKVYPEPDAEPDPLGQVGPSEDDPGSSDEEGGE